MTLTTDLVHDVIEYLVTACTQNPALGQAASPVIVVDGPQPPGEQVQTSPLVLWIGYDALNGGGEAGTATSRWPFVGVSGAYREEQGAITCTAQSWSGDPAPATARLLCKGIVGAVENMLRGYPTLGPGDTTMAGLVQWSQADQFSWTQNSSGGGFSAMCVFRVSYLARLAPN